MSGVLAEPLGSLHIVATLRRFVDLLSSSQGPNAGLKVVVTGGGVALVTSSSARIVRNLQLEDPVCLFVGQVVKAQLERCGDSGLYAGILMCRVVERVLSREDRLDVQRASRIIQRVALKLVRCLEEDGVRIPVEFSSVGQMLGVVRCVLSTKPACGLRKDDRESLAVSIVKAFLGTVENDMGHVIVTTGDGASVGFRVYRGILYQATDETLQSCYDGCNVSLLLFNFMLTENQKDDKISSKRSVDISAEDVGRENMLDDILSVFREAVKLNVKIIACQKVVHQSLKIYLRRKGILLLDRLGTAAASELAKLSGAVPISSVGSDVIDSLDSLLGRVDSVRLVHHDGKPYLCLERTDGNILTLFINAIGEEATSELQVLSQFWIKLAHIPPQAVCAQSY
ncbi:molecular chaperone MKKS-like isoform X1 [Bacillus rossius redtenbacheri]|uniref:molecular chaperone MKKS-like isoform X1 n=1 Tax=Bacillus rossius redtenbacheri TaxID=93214 RepID=UPI002FDE1219